MKSLFNPLALMLVVGSLWSQAHAQNVVPAPQPQKVLRIATTGTAAPFSMQGKYEGHNLDGLEIRMMCEVTKRLGVVYEPVVLQWDGLLTGVINEAFDFSSGVMDVTEEREKIVDFVPWFETSPSIVVAEDKEFNHLDQLKGLRVGAVVSSTFAKMAAEWGAGEVVSFVSQADGILALHQGKIDAMVSDRVMADYAIAKHDHLRLKVFVDPSFKKIIKGWAFPKSQKALHDHVEKILVEMKADGTYQSIVDSIFKSSK
jgi:polar amino acid transport system substrate-binding protein